MELLTHRVCTLLPPPPYPIDIATCLSKLVVWTYILTGVFLGSISGHSQPVVGIAKPQVVSCSVNCEMLAYRQSCMFSESKAGRASEGGHRES